MPKKKKTRKQKMLTDSRHQAEKNDVPTQQTFSYSVESPKRKETTISPKVSVSHAISTSEYSYLSKDLIKTFAVTGIIIFAEILLFFILNGVYK